MFRASRLAVGTVGALLLSVPSVGAAAAAAPEDEPAGALSLLERTSLLLATSAYTDVGSAVAAGYVPTEHCVANQGYHYFNPALVEDPGIDPTRPEVLLYEPSHDGTVRLVAIEYFKVDADGDTNTADDRPSLFGHPFDGPMAGHPLPAGEPPMPVHYDLHVWLYRTNPDGELAMRNPEVHCPDHG